jgi:hypothetical protein
VGLLLVTTTARPIVYCATAGALVGFALDTLVADWDVANLFSTLNRKIAAIAYAAKQDRNAQRKDAADRPRANTTGNKKR